ncbi:MAG: hypothetical protein AAEJ52_17850 [Myxococcota bacterium]
MGKTTHRFETLAASLPALVLLLGLGCTVGYSGRTHYEYFAESAPNDAWSHKIQSWQARERGGHTSELAPVSGSVATPSSGDRSSSALRAKYEVFRGDRKRAMARELAEWIQQQAHEHYVADGPIDHWATLEETFVQNGDDCDGLELLTYHLLRELGFGADEVFRSIVFRKKDGQHHMVTLWFEDSDDPWVIDPTGAMTSGMPRMSEVPSWTPLKVFSEERDFTVHTERRSEQLARN